MAVRCGVCEYESQTTMGFGKGGDEGNDAAPWGRVARRVWCMAGGKAHPLHDARTAPLHDGARVRIDTRLYCLWHTHRRHHTPCPHRERLCMRCMHALPIHGTR